MITTRVIQGSFSGGQPKLASVQLRVAPPPIQAKLAARPPAPAFAGRPPGPPSPAFAARPPGPTAPAFAARPGAVQWQGVGGAFAVEAGALGLAAGGGRPLPEALQGRMEAALRADFSAVRVHVGPQAERIGAIAFTLGSDIYFAPGRYQPETVAGRQLLGHELAHVVQQRAGRVKNPLGSGLAVVQDHALEAEADRLGRHAAAHRVAAQAKMPAAAAQLSAPVRVSPPTSAGSGSYRLTAGSGGREVGSVVVHARDNGAVEISDLNVAAAHRGRGIGRLLLASAAKTGRQFGGSRVSLAAQDSGSGRLTRWYKEIGFAQVGVSRRGYPQLEAPIGRVLAGAVQRRERQTTFAPAVRGTTGTRRRTVVNVDEPAEANGRINIGNIPTQSPKLRESYNSASSPPELKGIVSAAALAQRSALPNASGFAWRVLQQMQSGGAPSSFTNFTTMPWSQHQAAVNRGADQVGLRLYELNQGITTASNATALIIPTVDISSRTDNPHAQLSLQNIEQQSWVVTKRLNKRNSVGQSLSSDLGKQTEVIGELAAFNAIAKKYPQYEMAFAVDPGHGGGIDQLWIRKNTATGNVEAYLIVEAKGPTKGAKLSKNAFSQHAQMSSGWVLSRLTTLSNNSDPGVSGPAGLALAAFGQVGNGGTVPWVEGATYKAKWDEAKGTLTVSVSNKQQYN